MQRFCALCFGLAALPASAATPLLFVAQVPVPGNDQAQMTVTSSFANHLPTTASAPRGGDLMLCAVPVGQTQCSPGSGLRNLTAQAGYGSTGANGFQDANAIAVRDPAVNFDATRAAFSMVVGAPQSAGDPETYTWQLYEIDNLQAVLGGAVAHIVAVPHQPTAYNNIHPNYLSDGRLVFVSDRPRNGSPTLYPIKDEYRGQPANSGVWRLDPASGDLTLLEATPGGSFGPFVDSFGRLAFVRWDHLMQDNNDIAANAPVDYVDETSAVTQAATELYPEPIQSQAGSNVNGFEINQFFPWTVNQDGSGEETLNHVGRHELRFAVNKTFTDDPNLSVLQQPGNKAWISNFFQMREDPTAPGRYLGVDAPEFGTHTSGQIVAIAAASGGSLLGPEAMGVQYVNAKALSNTGGSGIGHFRDPLPRADGSLIASFANTFPVEPGGPTPSYHFRLATLDKNQAANADAVNNGYLTPGLTKTVSYFAGGQLVTQTNAALWELQPVEVATRSVPPAKLEPPLALPEQQAFASAGVLEADLRAFLKQQNLALVVMRNVAQRDDIDRQQPFNLHIATPGGVTILASPATGGLTYDLQWMQFFQADQVRAYGNPPNGIGGRRSQPRPLNDVSAVRFNPPDGIGANPGAKDIAADGSVALFVPAQRAMTWQSLSPMNVPVVRERYWVEFQPGEIRACDSCHGVNQLNQAQQGVYPQSSATAPPPAQALVDLLAWWKANGDLIFADGFGN